MNLTTLVNNARQRLEKDTSRFFEDAELIAWINEAYMKYVLQIINFNLNSFVTETSIDWTAGQASYALPSNVFKIIRVSRVFPDGTDVPLQHKYRFDDISTPYISMTGNSFYPTYDIYNVTNIVFEPAPIESVSGAVKVKYYYIPPRLINVPGQDEPDKSFPEVWHDMLHLYAVVQGLIKDENAHAASVAAVLDDFERKFENSLTEGVGRKFVEPFYF